MTDELTGRRRYRKALAGEPVLVLQVEYATFSTVYSTWILYWRDATPDDLGRGEVVIP